MNDNPECVDVRRKINNVPSGSIIPPGGDMEVLSNFMERYKLDKPTSGRVCINRLRGKQCSFSTHDHPHTLDSLIKKNKSYCRLTDHVALWLRDGKPAVWTSQPYGPLDGIVLAEAAEACRELGLELTVSSGSWWYPGWTVLLMVTPAKNQK